MMSPGVPEGGGGMGVEKFDRRIKSSVLVSFKLISYKKVCMQSCYDMGNLLKITLTI